MPEGFALRRNGTCLSSENSCGTTVSPFSACCPQDFYCSNPYNQVCCSRGSNCTLAIVERPVCSDTYWNLYNNGGVDAGYFCCLNGSTGYAATESNSNGCANAGVVLTAGEVKLAAISQASSSSATSAISTSTSASASISTSTSTSAPEPQSAPSPTNYVGIVVGLIVAFVLIALLTFWFIRRRRRNRARAMQNNNLALTNFYHELGHDNKPEIGGHAINELPAKNASVGFRPTGPKRINPPVELP